MAKSRTKFRTKTKTTSKKRTLSQSHRDNISKALKAFHAGKGRVRKSGKRRASNDNSAGAVKPETRMKTSRVNSKLPYENRYLSKRQLQSYRRLRSALKKHGARLNDHSTYNKAAHKAHKRYQRATTLNRFLSKVLPATKKRARR